MSGDEEICGLLLFGGLCVNLIASSLVAGKTEKQTKILGLAILL